MTKEFRITASDVTNVSGDECYLDPSDPAWSMIDDNLLTKRKMVPVEPCSETWEDRYIKEHNIKPGSPAWVALKQPK